MVLLWCIVTTEVIHKELAKRFSNTRSHTEKLIEPLETEDVNAQPEDFTSPPKWHLAHTTWFFEDFILKDLPGYQVFDPDHAFLFNSYYNSIGDRIPRDRRGVQTRPTLRHILNYRSHGTKSMLEYLETGEFSDHHRELVELGMAHEEQHQELLLMDLKYILGKQYLQPPYWRETTKQRVSQDELWLPVNSGLFDIGVQDVEFHFDNERPAHRVFLEDFEIRSNLVTNGEYLEFIRSSAYHHPQYWLDEGWKWKEENNVNAPLYWEHKDEEWFEYSLHGSKPLDLNAPVCHVSYYEADAYASFRHLRLPTEFEWEVAADSFKWGSRWEWTNSDYAPYPGFVKVPGAVGEYNGKFMVNQKVLRGASEVTPLGHSRKTYRNFFHPNMRWMFSGIRLAK